MVTIVGESPPPSPSSPELHGNDDDEDTKKNQSINWCKLMGIVLAAITLILMSFGSGLITMSADMQTVLIDSFKKATKGGFAGFSAGVLQVMVFMWMRTIMNHQYAHGGSVKSATMQLYAEGGFLRFYKGFSYAVVQAPLTRFGDTFFNTGAVTFFSHMHASLSIVTGFGSVLAALFRVLCTPIDTLKTTRQVHGDAAYNLLLLKVRQRGVRELFAGWEANWLASFAGGYPWFYVFNTLQELWPKWDGKSRHFRNGAIGICATITSDIVSNAIRVLKTIRQTHPDTDVGYLAAARAVVQNEGLPGLFGRGLPVRLFVNILQGLFFSILWKAFSE
eukprot:TRINITY_DN280_c0_g2_i10.p1 TRINITY_DN280_c0_g2~~TRINITY_DN280_c0_g2_i10.p1  ORF type:complete len:334 (+),score=27.35 TRINITY_DN280_c0_g2_i10:187-1188(+)